MSNKLEIFKKRLVYRASYRGTKEMDILLSKFVNKYINEFNDNQLQELEKFLDFDDEVILNFYNHGIEEKILMKMVYPRFLRNFQFNGGEGGSELTNELPRCWFSRPVLSTAQPPLQNLNCVYLFTIKVIK